MRIIVLQGSPNRAGSTAMLCGEFERGAREAGHDVERVDVAYADIAPCRYSSDSYEDGDVREDIDSANVHEDYKRGEINYADMDW